MSRHDPTERTCRRCDVVFVGGYNATKCPSCRDLARQECMSRFKEGNPDYWRKWARTNAPKVRESRLAKAYSLSLAEWESLADSQGRGCAICGSTGGWRANAGALVVDHCHDTGVVRGLLCPSCNRGLGQFEDDVERLLAAAGYIQRELERRARDNGNVEQVV